MENELIKKHIIAWDPDFTKVTDEERELLEKSDAEMKRGEYIPEEDIWSQAQWLQDDMQEGNCLL